MRANSKETKRSVIFPIVMTFFIVMSFTVLNVLFSLSEILAVFSVGNLSVQ
jgi:hypothetical protein